MAGKTAGPGLKKYLLFDDEYVKEKRGAELVLEKPICRQGPVLKPDRPWEKGGISGDSNISVIEDGGEYKMWYVVPLIKQGAETEEEMKRSLPASKLKNMDAKMLADFLSRPSYMLCYAVSRDGINWKKPELEITGHGGSKKNNIILIARLGCTVFLDPAAPPSRRYKLIYGGGPCLPHVNLCDNSSPGNIYFAVHGACSADGIHWKPFPKPIMPWYTDTTSVCYRDDETGKYAAFVRWNEGMVYRDGKTCSISHGRIAYRAVGRSESRDFTKFPPPENIHEPSERERTPHQKSMDYYNSSAIKYPFAPRSYFMFVSNFYHGSDLLDVHLAAGRDGKNYVHWKEPFIGLGAAGSFDSGMIYMGSGMLDKGAEILMYYNGYSQAHREAGNKRKPGSDGVGMVRLRKDGFVAQRFGLSGGMLETVPVKVEGGLLKLNMDAGAGGRLKVELRGEQGGPLPGYAASECENLWANDTDKTVSWNGKTDLSGIKGKKARLRFTGKSVRLFSFRFADKGE